MNCLLVEDHTLVREGIESHLRYIYPQARIHSAGSIRESLVRIAQCTLGVDVILMDLMLPDANGFSGITQLKQAAPKARLAVISADNSFATVSSALAMGALCYIPKTASMSVLDEGLRALMDGRPFVPQELLQSTASPHVEANPLYASLTQRQIQVLEDLLAGHANKVIALNMGISEQTVKMHVTQLFRHFNVSSRAQLILSCTGYRNPRPSS